MYVYNIYYILIYTSLGRKFFPRADPEQSSLYLFADHRYASDGERVLESTKGKTWKNFCPGGVYT